ncbi:MAG: autotransporter-associated beta strand repeat-containing protein, partial [Thermoguttaceae bacterium]
GGLTTPGQSGAFDLDLNLVPGYTGTQNIAEDFFNVNAQPQQWTALRIGSSDTTGLANTVGNITPSTSGNTYFLGGGGGTLTINSVLSDHNGGPTALEMGTSGQLLPGRIILNPGGTSHQNTYSGATLIRAGTLQLATANAIRNSSSLSVGTYSTGFNGLYTGALNGEFNGPGQLLLVPGVSYLGPVNARTLDGGAVGWTSDKTIGSLPGNWGTTLLSTLANPAGAPTNILHLGGEYSSGTMTKTINWIIADINPNSPVALVKSGPSVLDLSQGGANTYSGGTSILGGEIKVSDSNQLGSGPIFLTNAGTLHVNAAVAVTFNQTLKLYGGPTSGADLVQVDGTALNAYFTQPIDTTASPQSIVGIDGGGTLDFTAGNVPYPNNVPNGNRWGLYLNNGIIRINQMPINTVDGVNGADGALTGALIGNGGTLSVQPVPVGMPPATVNDQRYGFSSLATYQGTTTTIKVAAKTTLRINGSVASNFNGNLAISNTLDVNGNGEVEIASASPGNDATGNGTIDMGTGTLKLTQLSAAANASKLLPQSTGFTLKLNGGTFFGNVDGSINGNLIINDEASGGSSGFSVIQSVATPNSSALWVVAGSGLTSWNGILDKEGTGTVQFNRCTGAPVTLASTGADLLINGGTFIAGGTGDPFTDITTNLSLDIVNNSTATGLLISQGVKKVDNITGAGNTAVSGPAGTELIATSIAQNTLTIGAGCTVTIAAIPGGPLASTGLTPVPEPATWILLALAAAGLLSWPARSRLFKRDG